MSVIKMTDLDVAGKRVLIRQDLNVPIKDGEVASDKRIRASVPTIEHCIKAGAKVMIMSHLGRPTEGEYAEEFSLKPVATRLSALLDKKVTVYVTGSTVSAIWQMVMLCFARTCVLTLARKRTTTSYPKKWPTFATCM